MTTLTTEKNDACLAPDVALYSFNYLLFTLQHLVSNQQAQFNTSLKSYAHCVFRKSYISLINLSEKKKEKPTSSMEVFSFSLRYRIIYFTKMSQRMSRSNHRLLCICVRLRDGAFQYTTIISNNSIISLLSDFCRAVSFAHINTMNGSLPSKGP